MRKTTHIGSKIFSHLINRCARINHRPVIMMGNQKTGSTAIACLLGKATDSSVSQDFLYALRPSGQHLLFESGVPLKKLVQQNRVSFSKQIIKELDLIFCMDQVISCFPKGKFVFLVRDPRDNIGSILNRLKLPGNLDALSEKQLETLPHPAWRYIMEGTIYGIEGDDYIETLAKRWCCIIEQYEIYQSQMHLVRYEDFVADKVSCINQLAEQLGFSVIKDISGLVDIQFQPRGNRDISWEVFFGTKNLYAIETICGDKMKALGYKSVNNDLLG
jgi:hypothetical protein